MNDKLISLPGSVALGTGVMIGAGIFALVGQVAGLAGGWFPLAFIAGALVAGASSYAYARYSSVNPSAGGIAMLLKDAYGPGVVAGSFSMFMYVSMVIAESLLARTFGTYLLRPFGLQDSAVLVPVLGIVAIVAAAVVNLVGNRLVEDSALVTAVVKIVGIAVLAIAGLIGAAVAGGGFFAADAGETPDPLGAIAAIALCVLAYKGFTTITNQGDDVRDATRNIARSIAISIAICAVLYLLITVSVAASIGASGAVEARDYALAFRVAGNPEHRRVAEDTLDYLMREMRVHGGAFAAAQDVFQIMGLLRAQRGGQPGMQRTVDVKAWNHVFVFLPLAVHPAKAGTHGIHEQIVLCEQRGRALHQRHDQHRSYLHT